MKKRIIFALSILMSSYLFGNERETAVLLGLKNNQYGIIGVQYNHFQVGIKHSIFNENIKNQYVQFNFSYELFHKDLFSSKLTGSIGGVYSNDFYDTGVNLWCKFHPKLFSLSAELQPHYDSGIEYTTCYGFSGEYKITQEVALSVVYTNIPEFRIPEKRLRLGIFFNSKNLSVQPEMSIPSNEKIGAFRVLCSFIYRTNL